MSKSFNKRLQTWHAHSIGANRRGFRFSIHIIPVHSMVARAIGKGEGTVVSHQRKEFLAPV